MWIWIAIAVVAAIGEVLTTGLFFATVAVAALITAAATFFLGPFIQTAVFAALSLCGIVLVRPAVIQLLGIDALAQPVAAITHTHLIGRRATVSRTVDAHDGQIRVGEGEFWSARADDPSTIIPEGNAVDVVMVDGITALVIPAELPESLLSTSVPVSVEGE